MPRRSPALSRLVIVLALVAFYFLHQDLWLWNDPRLVLGIPVGLAYHVAYCLAASVLMLALVSAWRRRAGER